MELSDLDCLNIIAQSIYDKKGFNILALDVREISSITDYCIIAEGNVERHVMALAQDIKGQLGDAGIKPLFMEGHHNGDWAIVDFGAITVHLFIPELREKYRLEELWKESKIVDLDIKLQQDSSSIFNN